MSDNVESMFFTGAREKIWHGLGKDVGKALTSEEALMAAGLSWSVESRKVYQSGRRSLIPGYRANTRVGALAFDDEGNPRINKKTGKPVVLPEKVLAVVSNKYVIVQNRDAFSFVDELIGGGSVRYDTAGSLHGGAVVWMLAKMPARDILGDKVEPYLCFSTSHDGSSSVRACMTPVRVVCNNTLNLAISGARRSWAMRHVGKIESQIEKARFTIRLAHDYMDGFKRLAEKYAAAPVSEKLCRELAEAIYPLPANPESAKNVREAKKARCFWSLMLFCCKAPDIAKFHGTKWGVLNAVSDAVYHGAPLRETKGYRESLWGKSMVGNPLLDRAVRVLDSF